MSAIPGAAREAVWQREARRCARCSAYGSQVHHRKRRREGGHPLSVLIGLCRSCHNDWAHGHPEAARAEGYIVPTWASTLEVPVKTWRGWQLLDDLGGVEWLTSERALSLIADAGVDPAGRNSAKDTTTSGDEERN